MAIEGRLLSTELKFAGRLDARFFALLEALDATGSINRAARTAGLSFRGAWLLLDAACNLANVPLLETRTGGAGGGGTRLTDAARALLAAWRGLQAAQQEFLQQQEAQLDRDPAWAALFRRMSMKTSARNQFPGTVSALQLGPLSAEVTLALKGGEEIIATLSRTAADRMKLKKGREVLALVKASAVVLVADFGGYMLSARNQLAGTVSRIDKGAVASLVALTLPGGVRVSASVTNEGVEAMALKVGAAATAVFNADSVLVATAH